MPLISTSFRNNKFSIRTTLGVTRHFQEWKTSLIAPGTFLDRITDCETTIRLLFQIGHIGEWAGVADSGATDGANIYAVRNVDRKLDFRANGSKSVSWGNVNVGNRSRQGFEERLNRSTNDN